MTAHPTATTQDVVPGTTDTMKVTRVPWQVKFTALAFIWGSSFLLMKVGLRSLAPLQISGLRILSGGAVLLLLLTASKGRLPGDRRTWGHLMVTGFFLGSRPFEAVSRSSRTAPPLRMRKPEICSGARDLRPTFISRKLDPQMNASAVNLTCHGTRVTFMESVVPGTTSLVVAVMWSSTSCGLGQCPGRVHSQLLSAAGPRRCEPAQTAGWRECHLRQVRERQSYAAPRLDQRVDDVSDLRAGLVGGTAPAHSSTPDSTVAATDSQ